MYKNADEYHRSIAIRQYPEQHKGNVRTSPTQLAQSLVKRVLSDALFVLPDFKLITDKK